jgi:ELWxxDGT repeat protein
LGNSSRGKFRADFIEMLEQRRLLSADIFKGGVQPEHMTVLGKDLIFSAVDPTHGRELWSSQGTGKTTHLLADLNPGTDSSTDETPPPAYPVTPNDWLVVGSVLYFSGHDAKGAGLFRTDGTVKGTYKIAATGKPEHFVNIRSTLYFDDGANLWRSDAAAFRGDVATCSVRGCAAVPGYEWKWGA